MCITFLCITFPAEQIIGMGARWHQETVSGQRQEVTAELTSLRRQTLTSEKYNNKMMEK